MVLSAIGCGDGQLGPTSSGPDPTVSAGTPDSSDTGDTPTAVPRPILTSASVPTAASPVLAPLPPTQTLPTLLKSFYGLVSVSKQVILHVHELEWGLIRRYQDQVTILSAEIQTESGELVAQVPQRYMDQYWSGGIVAPGGQVSSVVDFPGRPIVQEMLTYRWVSKIRTDTQLTIICTFTAPSGRACVPVGPGSTVSPTPDPTQGGGKIAFDSYRDRNDEIYVMNADGSDWTRLTNWSHDNPAWGPGSFLVSRRHKDRFHVPTGREPRCISYERRRQRRTQKHVAAEGHVSSELESNCGQSEDGRCDAHTQFRGRPFDSRQAPSADRIPAPAAADDSVGFGAANVADNLDSRKERLCHR